MSSEPEKKVCPKCAETIRAKAKLCPHCQSSQGGIFVGRDKLLGGAIVLIWAVAIILGGILVLAPWVAGGHQFWQYGNDLKVYGIRMESAAKTNPPYSEFLLSGFVTNLGGCVWRIDELEVRYVDASGRLLNVEHTSPYPDNCVVGPRQVCSFKAPVYDLAFTNGDLTKSVRVTGASDANHKNWIN